MEYDVIVIGGGIAGLSTAAQLPEKKLLLLEKNAYLGGRICTGSFEKVYYDLGAVFAMAPEMLPFPVSLPEPIGEDHPFGVYLDGRLHRYHTVPEALNALLDAGDIRLLKQHLHQAKALPEIDDLSPRARSLLNGFFKVIHPGDIRRYRPECRLDALTRQRIEHFREGNRVIVARFRERIAGDIVLQADTRAVRRTAGRVEVSYRTGDGPRTAWGKTAVIATTAPAAAALIQAISDESAAFLDAVEYGRYAVAALGVPRGRAADFSYIVTPELSCDTILRQRSGHPDIEVLLVYYGDQKTAALPDLSESRLIEDSLENLRKTGIAPVTRGECRFAEGKIWEQGGTIISSAISQLFTPSCLQPAPGIYLAGDYTFRKYPFALYGAIQSGRQAAGMVRRHFQTLPRAV